MIPGVEFGIVNAQLSDAQDRQAVEKTFDQEVTYMRTKWLKLSAAALVLAGVNFWPLSETGAGPGQNKVAICHKGQTLELPEAAVQAHLNHGDTLGPCDVTPSKNR